MYEVFGCEAINMSMPIKLHEKLHSVALAKKLMFWMIIKNIYGGAI